MLLSRLSVLTPAPLLIALACAPALAQSAPAAAKPAATQPASPLTPVPDLKERDPNTWSVRIEPQVWYVAPEGKLTMPGSVPGTAPVKLDTLNADGPSASAAGQVTLRIPQNEANTWGTPDFWKSGWFFCVGGASFSGDSNSTAPAGGFTLGSLAVAGGAAVSTSVEWSTFHAMVGKWIVGSEFGTGGDIHADIYAVAGARMHFEDITVSSGGGSTTNSETFGSALLGTRLDIQLPYHFAVDIDVNVDFWPGDPSCFGFEIAPTFTWRPTNNLGVQIGYRLLIADCETGNENGPNFYKLDGSLAGLYGGIEIRF
jgi:hypothetical protein